MPPKKTQMMVIRPDSPMEQARLARELRRALAALREQGTLLPSTLPPIQVPSVRADDTPATAARRAIEAALPEPTTPAEQTARPGLIRRAIRAVTNRLAESLRDSGQRRGGRRGGGAAREALRRLRGRE